MATYTIRTWQIDTITQACIKTRKRRDAAMNEMWRQAYAVLAAFGKLDTEVAYKVRAEVEKCDDILSEGEQRNVVISNTGYSVTISRGGF